MAGGKLHFQYCRERDRRSSAARMLKSSSIAQGFGVAEPIGTTDSGGIMVIRQVPGRRRLGDNGNGCGFIQAAHIPY